MLGGTKMAYTIVRNLNNNVALATDDNQKDFIIFGKGIVYGKKSGEKVNEEDVVECYFLSRKDFSYFSEIMKTMDPMIVYVTDLIIKEIKDTIGGTFSANLLLMIADHINFAIERLNEGIAMKSPLENEIRRLYDKEVEVAKKALDIVEQELGVRLPVEEEAMIAMHIVNSHVGGEMLDDAMMVTEISNTIVDVITQQTGRVLDMKSNDMSRLLIHLRFFILKYSKNELVNDGEFDGLYNFLITKNPESAQCVKVIVITLNEKYGWSVTENDMIYLMLHINRLLQKKEG